MSVTAPDAELELLAGAGLDYLASDVGELARFLDFAGLDPARFRAAIGTGELTRGLIDYFAANESALVAMSANAGIDTQRFMRAWARLNAAE